MIGTGGAPVDADTLARCLHALRAFGSGEAGTWEGSAGGLTVALGARTPPNGSQAQPYLAADRGLALVADVDLDCHRDLTAALGHAGSSQLSDEDLILAAYERWGEACVEHLTGEFAFALVDRAAAECFWPGISSAPDRSLCTSDPGWSASRLRRWRSPTFLASDMT